MRLQTDLDSLVLGEARHTVSLPCYFPATIVLSKEKSADPGAGGQERASPGVALRIVGTGRYPLEKSGTQRRMLIAIPLRHTSQPGVNKCCQVFVVFFLLNFSPLVSGYVTVSLIIRPLQSLEHMRFCRHWSNKQDMDMMWNFYGVNKETMLRGDSNGSKGA